jgi:ABC-type uncharacterized transport system permease subunit
VQRVASWTPFPSMLSAPVHMLIHRQSLGDIATLLATQAGWTAGSVALAVVVWRIGVRRFEGVGA